MKKILLISIAILIPTQSNAELGWGFKSPAFNGNGYVFISKNDIPVAMKEDIKIAASMDTPINNVSSIMNHESCIMNHAS